MSIEEIAHDDLAITLLKVSSNKACYAIKLDTLFGTIVYCTDTNNIQNMKYLAKECDILICDSSYIKGQYRLDDNHLYAYEVAELAKEAFVKRLILTHFWPETDKQLYVNEAKKIFPNTEAAIEGKKLILRR